MIDIGANLSHSQFVEDREEVLKKSVQAGVEAIILTATDLNTFFVNQKIISQYSHIIPLYNTLGLHPHHADDYEIFFASFDHLIKDENIISIGEFGLDYFRMLSTQKNQQKTMEIFMEKARHFPIPLFLHERDAHEDFLAILKAYPVTNKKVVHCFTGDRDTLRNYLDNDCYIGITGWITEQKRGAVLREAAKYVPLDKLMIETDAPYLAPRNMKGNIRRNEPQFLSFVLEAVAEIKDIPPAELETHIMHNTVDFFGLSLYNKEKEKIWKYTK